MRLLVFAHIGSLPLCALLAELRRRGVEVLASCRPGSDGARSCAALGIPSRPTEVGFRFGPRLFGRVTQILEEFQPDIVHVFDQDVIFAVLWANRRAPATRVVFDRGVVKTAHRWHPFHRWVYFGDHICRFVTRSNAVAESLIASGVSRSRVRTLYLGHDPAWYEREPLDLRRELGIPTNTFLIGFIGRIRPVKGFDVLVRAVSLLPSKLALRTVVIGEDVGAKGHRMVEQSGQTHRFKFLGYRPESFRWSGSMDCVAIPSRSEGLPKVAFEAMSLRRAVVASRVGGLPELIDDGRDGLLVPPQDPHALAHALRLLAGDAPRREAMGLGARLKIETRFTVKQAAERALNIYREVGDGS